MARTHNCQAESNAQIIVIDWTPDGNRLVTVWGCKRCATRWCTIYDPAKAEQERLEARKARVQEIARKGW